MTDADRNRTDENARARSSSSDHDDAMNMYTLPAIEEGDYGWCLHIPESDAERPSIVLYDNDEDEEAIVYGQELWAGPYDAVPHSELKRFGVPAPCTVGASRKAGWIYAIALVPDLDLCRIKVGYTGRPIAQRLRTIRTTNPLAILLGLWDADKGDERSAIAVLGGRLGSSEVCQVTDPVEAMARLETHFRGAG